MSAPDVTVGTRIEARLARLGAELSASVHARVAWPEHSPFDVGA